MRKKGTSEELDHINRGTELQLSVIAHSAESALARLQREKAPESDISAARDLRNAAYAALAEFRTGRPDAMSVLDAQLDAVTEADGDSKE
jgi:hypothetical protein